MQGDDSPAALRLHAKRHGTCTARAGEPRSTTERACFTTCLEATPTRAAREVTLYLAVASPSSSGLTFLGLTAGSSSIPARARSGSAAAIPGSPDPCPGTDPGSAHPRARDRSFPSSSRLALPVPSLARRRSRPGPVTGSAAATSASPDSRPETARGSARRGPQLDRLPDGLAVVRRVRRQRDAELAGPAFLEQRRGRGLDRPELYGRTASSCGPGNTRSSVTMTLNA
jgi:hypothetical protein